MHGMTDAEMAMLRQIKATARTDLAAAKRMATKWFKDARSQVARQRRMNASRTVKHLYSADLRRS